MSISARPNKCIHLTHDAFTRLTYDVAANTTSTFASMPNMSTVTSFIDEFAEILYLLDLLFFIGFTRSTIFYRIY